MRPAQRQPTLLSQRGTSLLRPPIVTAALLALAVSSACSAGQNYPFRDAYPALRHGAWNHQAHALLTVPQARVHNGERFHVTVRLYNDGEGDDFYNVHWNRLIGLPGRLALYDAHKHYLCDLMEFVAGSQRAGTGPNDWSPIYAHGHADTTLSVTIPYPTPTPVPAGTYYLQVIYLGRAVELPFEVHPPDLRGGRELFRSDAVKITVD